MIGVTEARPVRAVIADDFPFLRRVMRDVLQSESGVEVIGEAESFEEVLHKVSYWQPHLLILDIGLVAGPRVDGLAQIRELSPATRIVLAGDENSPEYAETTRDWGCFKYLYKADFLGGVRELIDELQVLTESGARADRPA
ncbi:MAG TPA: response regulator [Dehalococcoidia bacterium]|nr:response regulator [Dehalococcoidia bacterium]